jgi:hypothetical protein
LTVAGVGEAVGVDAGFEDSAAEGEPFGGSIGLLTLVGSVGAGYGHR